MPASGDGALVEGLCYRPEHIEAGRADELAARIDDEPWCLDLKRRVQHYGYRYDYRTRSLGLDAFIGPLPDWLQTEARRLVEAGFFASRPDQVIVNEYQPGQGIAAHVDRTDCFGDTVAILSLLAAIDMDFSHPQSGQAVTLRLAPRSLLVLRGAARHLWRHGIAARKTDMVDSRRVARARRLSVTFRKVVPA